MKIVLITDGSRPELFKQTLDSAKANAADWSRHQIYPVFDGTLEDQMAFQAAHGVLMGGTYVKSGVGAAKNRGTTLIPKPKPDDLLMFLDDDLYLLPGWDSAFEDTIAARELGGAPVTQLGGWRHPYHERGRQLGQGRKGGIYGVDAVTGNCFVIRWSDWIKYGPFPDNAIGPGQSEDFALSQRIKQGGGLVATLDPPVAIHCGLVNSDGEPATGWREMEDMITTQLAGLSAEMRDEILIMRPAPEGVTGPSYCRYEMSGDGQVYEHRYHNSGFDGLRVSKPHHIEIAEAHEKAAGIQPDTNPYPMVFFYPPEELRVGYEKRGNRPTQAEVAAEKLNAAVAEMGYEPTDLELMVPYGRTYEIDFTKPLSANIGSGQRRFESTPEMQWLNVDCVSRPPDQIPDIICDVGRERLPLADNTADFVVAHHLYEHYHLGEGDAMIAEAYRILKPGGSLLVFTPDLRKLAGRWLNGEIDDFTMMVQTFGAYQGLPGDDHHWGYSQESLKKALHSALPTKHDWSWLRKFDWREIPGADLARDWYIAAVECVK
jgi:SAM-dependent methyltransferase